MKNTQNIIQNCLSWTPEIIVSLISEIAWPIVIIFFLFKFKGSLKQALSNFFKKNNITEISAGTAGVSAKFEANRQEKEKNILKPSGTINPPGLDAESIKIDQVEESTEFSNEILEDVKKDVAALDIIDTEKIELLSTEISLLKASLTFMDISTILFLSQYEIFNEYLYPNNTITLKEVEQHINDIAEDSPGKLEGWGAHKYLAFPISGGLLKKTDFGYQLTKLGLSYVKYIRNNPSVHKYLIH